MAGRSTSGRGTPTRRSTPAGGPGREPVPVHRLREDPGRRGAGRAADAGFPGVTSLLIGPCEVVATMDDDGTELPGGSILVEDGVIAWVGEGEAPPDLAAGATVVDGRGCVALPGLVNTHHHLYQALTRARAQGKDLFGWLTELYPVWAALDTEWV